MFNGVRVPCMNIYVGNLSYGMSEGDLRQAFSAFGEVSSVKILMDRDTGRSRGFGFVEMLNDDQGRAACEALDQREFEGRRLTVNEAKPQVRSGGGGGGYGRQNREARW